MENKRLDPDAELFEAQDYEVEVPPCERGANPGLPGKNRIDQRMPLEPGHRLPSPFQSKRRLKPAR